MNTIIIAANLGHLKAYRIVRTPTRGLGLELIEEMNFPEAHGHFADKVTDMAGRFPVSEGSGPSQQMAAGEALTAVLETQRRLTKLVGEQVEAILRRERPGGWGFAATSEIHQAILDEMTPEVRGWLIREVAADLTKVPPASVLTHFMPNFKRV